jgi:hypothetical protein
MEMRLSDLRSTVLCTPGRFLVLISVKGWVDLRAIVRLKGLDKLKKSNELIGNRTRDIPACSIVASLPRVPYSIVWSLKLARLHPLRARASYRPVGLALWDSWGELTGTKYPRTFLNAVPITATVGWNTTGRMNFVYTFSPVCIDKWPCDGLTHQLRSLTEFPSEQMILKLKENICAWERERERK